MRVFALHVALDSVSSEALTYACGVAYATLTIGLLYRYLHNVFVRGLGVSKLSMLLLLGFVVYCGARSITLVYSAVVGYISNTMLILPTSLYLLLMGFMAKLWSMYLGLLLSEKGRPRAHTSSMVVGNVGAVDRRLTPTPEIRSPMAQAQHVYVPPSPLMRPGGSRNVCSAGPTAHQRLSCVQFVDIEPAQPPSLTVQRTTVSEGDDAATERTEQLNDNADTLAPQPPSALPIGCPSPRPLMSCVASSFSQHPLSSAVILIATSCAVLIFVLGILCSDVNDLEHTHCVDVPSIADVVACWACGGLMVMLAYRLRRCEEPMGGQEPVAAGGVHLPRAAHHHHPQQRYAPSSYLGVPWVSSAASISSSDPEIDQYEQQHSDMEENSGGDRHLPPQQQPATTPKDAQRSEQQLCCRACPVSGTCWYASLHTRTVAAAFLFGGYTITRGCAVASNIFAAEQNDITNQNEEYLTPMFYVVEWVCLVLCVRLIVGPPARTPSAAH